MIQIYVPGKVMGKQRPRFNTRTGNAYTPNKTVNYENYIKLCFFQKYGLKTKIEYDSDVPLEVEIIAMYSIPKSTPKKRRKLIEAKKEFPTKKPDIDNIAKIACDALNGVAYADDKQIVKATITKKYNVDEGLIIKIYEYGKGEENE